MEQKIQFNRGNNKGIALILSVGILAILATIGCTFALTSLIELKAASNYLYGVKARYLAEAGAARAIAELKYGTEGACATAVNSASGTWASTGYTATILPNNSGYSVSIIDCARRISLAGNQSSGYNAHLSQILQNLNSVIGGTLSSGDCDNIAAGRPYISKELIKNVLTGSAAQKQAKYNAIADYITIFGYVDTNTRNPQDLTTPYALQYRSPVNVNTASAEVLRAVLMGITARHSCPMCGGDGYLFDVLLNHLDCPYCEGSGSPSNITGNLIITATKAQNLAQDIITNRPYSSWDGFYSSVKTFFNPVGTTSSDQEAVMANANPNTGFSWARNAGWGTRLGYTGKYVIDIDKNSVSNNDDKGLTVSTTEFCFNSGGYYEISATGTVRNKAGIVAGQKNITAIVQVFDTLRQATQSQFEAVGSAKSNVQTYPEPSGVGISPAQYSGEIMLARKTHTTPNSGNYFRADYSTTLNGDAGGSGSPVPLQNPPNPGSGPQGTMPNIASTANFSNRGELTPDGMVVDTFDNVCPDYLPSSNIDYALCTMEIWFKAMWPSNDTKMYNDDDFNRKIYRLMSRDEIGVVGSLTWPFSTFVYYSQNFGGVPKNVSIGAQGYGYWDGPGVHWDYFPRAPEGSGEYQIEFARNYAGTELMGSWNPGAWHQVVFTWKEPAGGGQCTPPNTKDHTDPFGWPGDYVRDLKVYFDGDAKFADFYFHHLPYLNNTAYQYFMVGHEWWQGSGATSHYVRNQLNGIIGSVRVWNTGLDSSQIRAEYGNGVYQNSGTYTSPTLTAPGGTQVEWGTVTWTQAIPTSDESITMDVNTGSGFAGGWTSPGSGQVINVKAASVSFRAALGGAGGSVLQPNTQLLLTPGFECADPITDWVHEWAPLNFWSLPGPPAPPEGGKMAKCWWDGGMLQDVAVTPGKNYRLTGWAYIPSGGSGPWGSFIGFRMGTYNTQWNVHWPPYNRDQWNQIDSGWVTASAGATTARVRFGTWQSGATPANPTYFDNFALLEQGSVMAIPTLETPVLEDVSITYLPQTKVLYWR